MPFLSDNLPRSRRVEQLINDCSNFEQFVIDEEVRMDNRSPFIVPTINRIMRENGLTTWTELRDRVSAMLPPDLRIQYLLLAENAVDSRNVVDMMFMIISAIAITGGVAASGARFARFIAMGGTTIAVRAAANGLRMVLRGQTAAATRYFARAGNLSSGVVRVGGLVNPRFLRILHVVQVTGRVVGWFAFGLDVLLGIFAVLEHVRQRNELQAATRDLFARRLQMRLLQLQAGAAMSFYADAERFLLIPEDVRRFMERRGHSEAEILEEIEYEQNFMSERIGTRIATLQEQHNFENTAARLREQDNGRNSWTNEDPTFDQAMQRIEQETNNMTARF